MWYGGSMRKFVPHNRITPGFWYLRTSAPPGYTVASVLKIVLGPNTGQLKVWLIDYEGWTDLEAFGDEDFISPVPDPFQGIDRVLSVSQATHLSVAAEVRYWEDAKVDGIQDDEHGTSIPGRDSDLWKIRIRLSDGLIENWPQGTTASIHYKVCDAGLYYLETSDGTRILKRDGYVPDKFLCFGGSGYGDYIIFDVLEDGHIDGYKAPVVDEELLGNGWERA